jgi:GR25 family glycosyltransferase involved in LPS biosynthesis
MNEFINDICDFRCLCYKNTQRHKNMKERFYNAGLILSIYDGVEHYDPRIVDNCVRKTNDSVKRLWSVTYGHLDMIKMFYESSKRYGFFCEYDIVICDKFIEKIPSLMEEFDQLDVDILLLGYMTTCSIPSNTSINIDMGKSDYSYHRYSDEQWGAHLYMINKAGAKRILDEYAYGYADRTINDPSKSFSPDWTITKIQRRALMYPMMAVEDGTDTMEHYGHYGQYIFHMETFHFNTKGRIFF